MASTDRSSPPPAPRHRYGRARPASPTDDAAASFITSEPQPAISPGKVLVDRWQSSRSDFMSSVKDLMSDPVPDPSEDEVQNFIAARKAKATAAIRRKTLGVSSTEAEPQASTLLATVYKPTAALQPTSPLTELSESDAPTPRARAPAPRPETVQASTPPPSSPPRLPVAISSSLSSAPPQSSPSPPRLPAEISISIPPAREATPVQEEEETFPIAKPGKVRRRHRHIAESSDEEDAPVRAPASSPSPSPRRPPPSKLRSPPAAVPQSPLFGSDSEKEATPVSPARHSPPADKAAPSPNLDDGSDSDDREMSPDDDMPKGNMDFIEQLRAEEAREQAEEAKRAKSVETAESIQATGSSAEQRAGSGSPKRFGGKLKALSKKEEKKLNSEIASAQRRPIETHRPEPKNLRKFTAWLPVAADMLSKPVTQRHTPSPMADPSTLVEPIEIYPSSGGPHSGARAVSPTQAPSSPTRKTEKSSTAGVVKTPVEEEEEIMPTIKRYAPMDSDDEEEDRAETSIFDLIQQVTTDKEREAEKERLLQEAAAEKKTKDEVRRLKQEDLARRKEAEIARRKAAGKAKATTQLPDDDDEIEFEDSPVKPKARTQPVVKPGKRGTDPARMLMDYNRPPAQDLARLKILGMAGVKPKGKQETLTESYLLTAATTFKHDQARASNAGSVPAGQKPNRDKTVTGDRMVQYLHERHLAQAEKERRLKEERYGKGRSLPAVQPADYASLKERAEMVASMKQAEEEDEEEDPEDGDYQGSGEEGSGDEGGDEMADEPEAEAVEGDVEDMEVDTEPLSPRKSPLPNAAVVEEEETLSPIKPKSRRRKVKFESSDEDEPKKATTPAAPLVVPVGELGPANIAAHGFGEELDLAGFGDDGEGGFSQLFDPTQINTQAKGGFDALRVDPVGLLDAHAILPKNIISDTQAERDNALLAAEMEAAMATPVREPTQPKPQYLNDAGFFTQTKPPSQYPTLPMNALTVSSSWDDVRASQLAIPATRPDTANDAANEHEIADYDPTVNPPELSPKLTRLRRRAPDENVDVSMLEPTQHTQQSAQHTQRNSTPAPAQSPTSPVQRSKDVNTVLMSRRSISPVPKGKQTKSAFVEGEAEESDEDIGFGMPRAKEDEEEEGPDEYDQRQLDDTEVDEETKRQMDAARDEKNREMQKLDDEKREAYARKLAAGGMRNGRKGRHGAGDLYSDDEDEDESSARKRRRMNKTQRKLAREVEKRNVVLMDGESFEAFEQTVESDTDDDEIEEDETPVVRSPEPIKTLQQTKAQLQKVSEMNRRDDLHFSDRRLDRFGPYGTQLDDDLMDVDEESRFDILKTTRTATVPQLDEDSSYGHLPRRTAAENKTFYEQESQANYRPVGITNSSVVMKAMPVAKPTRGDQKYGAKKPRGSGASIGGRVLVSKNGSFAK